MPTRKNHKSKKSNNKFRKTRSKSQTTKSKNKTRSKRQRGGNGETCSICTEDFIENFITTTTECNHKFHTDCIRSWCLMNREHTTCPMCRRNIDHVCREFADHDNLESELLTDLEKRLFDAIYINDAYHVEEALLLSMYNDVNVINHALLDINIKNDNGDTPLTLATKFNNVDIVALLLHYGADVDKLNDGNASAYHIVTSTTRNTDIISLLRRYGTQYYHPNDESRLGGKQKSKKTRKKV
jgi:hypothetical protein